MRKLFTFSIDSKGARALDDAISVKPIIKDGKVYELKIFVHISDVAALVKEGTAID